MDETGPGNSVHFMEKEGKRRWGWREHNVEKRKGEN